MKRQYENMNNAQKVNEFLGIGKRDRSDKINNNNPKYKKIVKGKLYDNCLDEIKKIINQHQPINNEMTPFYYIVSNIIKYDNKKKNYLQFIQEMKLKVTKKKIKDKQRFERKISKRSRCRNQIRKINKAKQREMFCIIFL